jgi:hypothetical protein
MEAQEAMMNGVAVRDNGLTDFLARWVLRREAGPGTRQKRNMIAENAKSRLAILPTSHHRVMGPIYEDRPKSINTSLFAMFLSFASS